MDIVIGAKEKIASLRAVLVSCAKPQRRIASGIAHLDCVLGGGLRQGSLHEVFAAASHEASATAFVTGQAFQIGKPVLWVALDYAVLEYGELAPTGFLETGFSPERLIFLRVPDVTSALRAALDGLSCTALGCVVIELAGEPKSLDLIAYRKLVLAAEASGVTVFFLRFSASPRIGAAETRWHVRAMPSAENKNWGNPVFEVELQRNRMGPGGIWVMEWSCDDGLFRTADHRPMVSSFGNGPASAALEEVSAA